MCAAPWRAGRACRDRWRATSHSGAMGKRKAKKVVVKKAGKPRLDVVFTCPMCAAEASVECRLDRARQTGAVLCRGCRGGYRTVVNNLTEPVDVFHEWVDAIAEQAALKRERLVPGGEDG